MRILLIGNPSLYNDSIKKLLISKEDFELYQITAHQFIAEEYSSPNPPCDVSLFDVTSFADNVEKYIKQVISKAFSKYLIVLHPNHSNESTQQLLQTGADDCLSLHAEVDELIGTLSRYKN